MRTIANPDTKLLLLLRYRDVAAAVDWLCRALGFEKHEINTAVDGTILDARLMFGNDMILLLPARGPARGLARLGKQIRANMRSCYFAVDDVDLHYRHAKAAGAEILDIREYDYGGRGYSCRDPEGHIWNFGSYDPWKARGPRQPAYWRTKLRLGTAAGIKSLRDNISPSIVIAAVVGAAIAIPIVGLILASSQPKPTAQMKEFEARASIQRSDEATEHVGPQAAGPPTERPTDPPQLTTEELIRQMRATQPTAENSQRKVHP
jgi:uncharacterized glyoxalase superfamily protein PhnB